MEINDWIGLAAGCLTAASLIPQLVKVLKEKKVEGVSPFMFLILMAGNGLWLYYGIIIEDTPIMVTNSFSLLMDIALFILRFVYGDGKSSRR